jgi:signal transduction histidine kinase/CheY-like chemotaxis protein
MTLHILHLEDNPDDVELVRRALLRRGLACQIQPVASKAEYLTALDESEVDVILSDSSLPGYAGSDALAAARVHRPDVPFIIVSAHLPAREELNPLDLDVAARVSKAELQLLPDAIQRAVREADEAAAPMEPAKANPSYVTGMEHLVQVVQRLSLARDLPAIMAIVRRAARELVCADGATFVLRDGNHCYYADEDAISALWKGQRFPLESCISGWAMTHRTAVSIPRIVDDPRIPQDAYRKTFVKSLLMVPIRTQDPIGAIGAYWAIEREPAEWEMRLLQALADSTCVAMEAAQLLETLEHRVAERTQEVRQRSNELEILNRELETFSYSVAHDLRSPLIAISGFSEDLLENNTSRLDSLAREQLERISSAALRMHGLIDDLLGLAKIARAPLQRRPVDLAQLAREVAQEFRPTIPPRDIECVIPNELQTNGDRGLIRILLQNLLGNAFKFTARRSAARIEVGSQTNENGEREFFVRDNGSGFDPRYAAKLFRPFERLHTRAEFPGSGIGLATAQRVVHRHGGQIRAESQVDFGATVFFTLPEA